MTRGIDAVEAVQSLLPEWTVLPFGLLTQLGDVWFVCTLLAIAYWLRPADREAVAVVGALALVAIGAMDVLKPLFGLARPGTPLGGPEAYPALLRDLHGLTATASGYGFPSGHATLSTTAYLALAAALSIGRSRRRFGAAAALIVLVSASRVALGVHYLVDVVAGVLLGTILLVATALVLRASPLDRPTTVFALAAGIAVVAVPISDTSPQALALLGAIVGAAVGWQVVSLRDTGSSGAVSVSAGGRWSAPSVRRGLAVAGGSVLVAATVAGVGLGRLPVAGAGLAGALAAAVLAAPVWIAPSAIPAAR